MNQDVIIDIAREKAFKQLAKTILTEKDSVMVILRAHLLTENLLENLIRIGLPRGDKIIEEGGLSYSQKLLLVASLDQIPDSIISSLKNLNKVRNQCAHELDKKITESEVIKIGSPLGKKFSDIKGKTKFDDFVTLKNVLAHVVGYINGCLYTLEHKEKLVEEGKIERQHT